MPNHGQLNLLSDDQVAAIRADSQLKCAEIVKVYWPSPDGTKAYTWWNCLADPAYTTPLSEWLDGAPFIPAFRADDPRERFHDIPRTSAIGDDVVSMRFSNDAQIFEALAYKHRGGVKIEIFYFFPEIPDDVAGTDYTAISWWLGHLRTPDSADRDWVNVTAANGQRSSDLLLPNRPCGSNCTFYFGGELTADEIADNPCKYDRHLGGSRGTLNAGQPWKFCEHTIEACSRILGDTLSYGGDNTTVDTVLVGAGEHKTVSTTVGNESRLKEPKRVIYGTRYVRQLRPMAYRREINPSPKHPDKGTLLTLFEVSEGRIKSMNNIMIIGMPPNGGLQIRLGGQDQAKTDFSPNALNYNHLALFNGNLNPIDPTTVNISQLTAECDVEGRDEIKIYSDPNTFTRQFTNSRAWCFLDLLTNQWYGHRLDPVRFRIEDFIYLASKGSPFDCDVQGKSAQQQIYDICLAGMWYLPFHYNGIIRVLPIEDVDLTADDIPVFTDQGPNANILRRPPEEGGLSRLEVSYKDDDKIPNCVTLTFEDAEHGYIERPLLFEDYQAQYRAGRLYGDKSKRKVEQAYAAFGLTHLGDAKTLGDYLLSIGPFGSGGINNNCTVELALDAFNPDALNLHENKVIAVVSPKLDPYVDIEGTGFEFFLVQSMYRNSRAELIVKAQAYARTAALSCVPIQWTDLVDAQVNADNSLEKIAGDSFCVENATGTGNAGGWSVQTFNGGNWEISWNFGSVPEGRGFVGLTTGSSYSTDYHTYRYCIHVSDQNNTLDPYPPHSVFIYELGVLKAVIPGDYIAGKTLRIRGTGTTITYWFENTLWYTSAFAPVFPMRLAASLACINKTVNDAMLCFGTSFSAVNSGGTTTTQDAAPSAPVLVDRIFRDTDLAAGVPGFYLGAAPTNSTDAWAAASLFVDRGGGYTEIAEVETPAILGDAATVLAGTTTGSETVDVDLQPGQMLASYSPSEVAAGAGLVFLGGEIFQYQTAAQQSMTPNRWRLSVLSNRGAKCTTAAIATHAIGDDFLLLNDAVIFVQTPVLEIGQTRNYKIVTAGEDIIGVTPFAFTLNAPNFKPTTPADYAVSFDPVRSEVVHTWTPISDPCLVATGLVYEIYDDASGAPGALLWTGVSNQWREPVTGTGTRTYHFRARTTYVSGDYVMDSVSLDGAGYGASGYGSSYGQ